MTAQSWSGRTVLITGGTGFIGKALAQKLSELGATVIVPTRDRSRIGKRENPRVRYVPSLSASSVEAMSLLGGVSVVFNLAYDFRRSADDNFALYEVVANACLAASVPMLVQASSIAVYDGWPVENIDENSPCDGPGHAYKQAKRAMERDIAQRVAQGQFDAVILQPTIVYGPGSSQWTDALVERMLGGAVHLPENLPGLCNGVYVDDVVDAFIAAADLDRGNARRFILSGPRPFLWSDMFKAYADACGAQVILDAPSDYQPSLGAPARPASGARAGLSALVQRMSATLIGVVGTTRFERLRTRIVRMRPGHADYRPASEQPRQFHARGIAHTQAASATFFTAQVDAEEGLARTCDYIRTKYPARNR